MTEPGIPPEVEVNVVNPGGVTSPVISQSTDVSEVPLSSTNNSSGSSTASVSDTVGTTTLDEDKKKCVALLRFIALSEEMQNTGKCFNKTYNSSNTSEWTENHYFQKRTKAAVATKKKKPTEKKKTQSKDELFTTCKGLGLQVTTKMNKDKLLDMLATHVNSSAKTEETAGGEDSKPVAADDDDGEVGADDDDVLAGNVILNSYEYNTLLEKLSFENGDTKTAAADVPWMTFSCPDKPDQEPVITESVSDSKLREYLEFIKKKESEKGSERFAGCHDLNSMIPLLVGDDVPAQKPGSDYIRNFIMASLKHSVYEKMEPIYEQLFEWQSTAGSEQPSELYLGFGHVRMIMTTTKNGKPHESRIVNGPLFEVPVEAKLQDEGHGGSANITIRPKHDAEIALNGEVFSAIISGGKSNALLIDKLHKLVEMTNVSSLRPDHPKSFLPLLRTASLLSCGGTVRSTKNDSNVHRLPENRQTLVITDAFCLYSKQKKSTNFSRDARNLIRALKSGELEMTEPIRALISGPEYLDRAKSQEDTVKAEIEDTVKAENLIYTLPASAHQKEVGVKLLVEGEPVLNLVGPPGTGKTHSIVNVAATSLSESKSVIVASSNPRALKAFVDKLPEKLRNLALDISSVEEHGVLQFQTALETMIRSFQTTDEGQSDIERASKRINKKKEELKEILEQLEKATKEARNVLSNANFKNVIELASDLSPWLVKSILTGNRVVVGLKKKVENHSEQVTFEGSVDDYLADDFLRLVQEKAAKANEDNSTFNFDDTPSVDQRLSLVKVGGRAPTSQADWESVANDLIFRKDCIKPLLDSDCGCEERDIFTDEGSLKSDSLIPLLSKGSKLEDAVKPLEENLKERLKSTFEDIATSQVQNDYRKLTSEIQDLESELVYLKVIVSLKKRLGKDAMSTLKQMISQLNRMRSAALGSGNTMTERSSRQFLTFTSLFKRAAAFMPFLVMTIEQISIYLPTDHSCDIGIIDEASQSSCTAITFMARSKQMLISGDDKQVSPSQCFLSEERIRGLMQSLPGIPTDEQLLPESSFFDLCQAAFPSNDVYLSEHYRCDPDIIAISNQLFYLNALIPLRIRGKSHALEDVLVDGTRDSKGLNEVEAQEIATRVCDKIKCTAKEKHFQTIGVISVSAKQCALIKKLVDEGVEGLIAEFGSAVVDRHNILYGTSQQAQGDERDIIFLSCVYSRPAKSGQKLKQDDNWKAWNVALTRAKNKLILCRSFGIKDLKTTDIRSKIFRFFLDSSKRVTYNEATTKMKLESDPMVDRVESALSTALKKKGYDINKKGGAIWSDALCVCVQSPTSNNKCALLHVENRGESKEDWKTMFDQQLSLERAGRPCLRVDYLSLALNFDYALEDVLAFLEKSGLPRSNKRGATNTAAVAAVAAASSSSAKKQKTEESGDDASKK